MLSNVENANGIVTLLKELGRKNEASVAVAATHCLRRVFSQLLDPAKNPQVNQILKRLRDWENISQTGGITLPFVVSMDVGNYDVHESSRSRVHRARSDFCVAMFRFIPTRWISVDDSHLLSCESAGNGDSIRPCRVAQSRREPPPNDPSRKQTDRPLSAWSLPPPPTFQSFLGQPRSPPRSTEA